MSRFFRHADDSDSDTESSSEELISSGDEDAAPARPAAAAKPMSRFLKTAGSDSDSSSSSDSDSESGSDDEDADAASEDSDDGVKRVPKSAKDKRLEEMEATGKSMDNALKINDWIAISTGE
jgi:translation initiation factor 3 subunit C